MLATSSEPFAVKALQRLLHATIYVVWVPVAWLLDPAILGSDSSLVPFARGAQLALGPVVIWAVTRRASDATADHGRQSANLAATSALFAVVGFAGLDANNSFVFWIAVLSGLYALGVLAFFTLLAVVAILAGRRFRIPSLFAWKLLKRQPLVTRRLKVAIGSRPGWRFHTLALLVPLAVLWAASVPGVNFFLLMGAMYVAGLLGLIWLVRLVAWWRTSDRFGSARPWITMPVIALATLAALLSIAFDIPVKARFAIAQETFDAVVANMPPRSDFYFSDDLWVGGYRITGVYQSGDGVIFREATGALFQDAGFAYLPSGPSANYGLEDPQFRHLTGNWYAWTSSW